MGVRDLVFGPHKSHMRPTAPQFPRRPLCTAAPPSTAARDRAALHGTATPALRRRVQRRRQN